MSRVHLHRFLAALLGLAGAACETTERPRPGPTEASPNASLTPAPLLSGKSLVLAPESSAKPASAGTSSSKRLMTPSGGAERTSQGPAPIPLHRALAADLHKPKASAALGLNATLEWAKPASSLDLTALGEAPSRETNQLLRPMLRIELRALGRMSIELTSRAFSLPQGTRFVSRSDGLGHLLVWPSGKFYRTLGQGSVRALLSEGRPDVTPMLRGKVELEKPGKRLGQRTERIRLRGARGELLLEQFQAEGSGRAGPLLCRWLLELLSLQPSAAVCGEGRVPVWARIRDENGGDMTFAVTNISRRTEGTPPLHAPPPYAKFKKHGLPIKDDSLLTRAERQALKQAAPAATLTVRNNTAFGAYLMLEGTRISFVRPHSEAVIGGFAETEHLLGYRTFFGKVLRESRRVMLPRTLNVGTSRDAGVNFGR